MPKFTWTTLTKDILEGYVRQDTPNSRVIVFVHGFTGHFKDTWKPKGNTQMFLDLINNDQELADFDVLSFGYKSGVLGGPSVKTISTALMRQIETHLNNRSIVFIAHSMGGLVCMRYRKRIT